MSDMTKLNDRKARIDKCASAVRKVCVNAQFNGGAFIKDAGARNESIQSAMSQDPLFESLGAEHGLAIATAWGSAVRDYVNTYGENPRDDVLASGYQAMENLCFLESKAGSGEHRGEVPMLESMGASLATSAGVDMRARSIGLVLPTALAAATADAATFIPGGANEAEIFRLHRIAGSNFGDYKKGQVIDHHSMGQYSSMNQLWAFKTLPNGTLTTYAFDSAVDGFGAVPFLKGHTKLHVDRRQAAAEVSNQSGKLFGTITLGSVEYTINGTIDYALGKADITSSPALPNATPLHLEFDVNHESNSIYIPTIQQEMTSVTLKPHQSVIASEHTIQAAWMMQREHNVDLRSQNMSNQRNYIAYDKDIRALRKMLFVARSAEGFDLTVPVGQYFKEHYETLHQVLLSLSQSMLVGTRVSGMVGAFVGASASAAIKSLGSPHFEMAPNYRQVPRIHYVGKLFGKWKIYEVPNEITLSADVKLSTWDILCYARGEQYAEAGLVMGDAIPAIMYDHLVNKDLVGRDTLWELSYCDIHPDGGADFFKKLTLTPAA